MLQTVLIRRSWTQNGHSAIVGAYVKLSIVVTAHGAT